jgi:hypothetical protein
MGGNAAWRKSNMENSGALEEKLPSLWYHAITNNANKRAIYSSLHYNMCPKTQETIWTKELRLSSAIAKIRFYPEYRYRDYPDRADSFVTAHAFSLGRADIFGRFLYTSPYLQTASKLGLDGEPQRQHQGYRFARASA